MKLIACNIDGFGKYDNARFSFAEGLTSEVMENGEGKTTLSVFLRVMLYGMSTDRRNSFGVRSTYNPFHSGKYGGSLEVEWHGKTYKIVRALDRLSAAKDVLAVYNDRGEICDDLGEIPGETLFGLTEEAFMRTSFVTWKQLDVDLENGIGERLGGVSASGETVPLGEALKSLEEYVKTYHSGRKKAGAYTGYVPETEEKIEDTQQEIYRLEGLQSSLAQQRADWKASFAESDALAEEYDAAQKAEAVRLRYENYRSLCQVAEEEKAKLDALSARYKSGFPTAEEMQSVRAGLDGVKAVRARLQYRDFPKQKELTSKESQFAEYGVPTSEQLMQKETLVDQYNETVREITVEQTRIERANAEAAEAQMQAQTVSAQKKTPVLKVVLLIAAALFAAVGLILVSTQLLAGLGCICGAAVLAAVAFIVGGKQAPAEEISSRTVTPVLSSQIHLLQQSATQYKTSLEDFFARYGVRVSDFVAALRILREDAQTLKTLRAEKEGYEQETFALKEEEKRFAQAVQDVLQAYGLTEGSWEEAYNDSRLYAELSRSVKVKAAQAEEYREKFGITEEPQPVGDVDELKWKARQAEEKTKAAQALLQATERELEELPKQYALLKELKEKLAKYKERKTLIEVTMSSLEAADANLKDRYLLPMQTAFLKYARMMGLEWAETVALGDELQIQFEAHGQLRRAEHLSDGQRALANLCMRFAVIENVYDGELPFCIFDDPFVHLDEKHLEEVRQGMRALSAHMQMLYFTCHPSRTMEIEEKA